MGMMSWLAEQRIQESMRNGEFRDLPVAWQAAGARGFIGCAGRIADVF